MNTTHAFPLAAAAVVVMIGFAWAWSLADALKRPQTQWENAQQHKNAWVAVLVILGPLGALLYTLTARPELKQFQYKAAPTVFDPTAFGVPDGGVAYPGDGFRPTGA